MIRLTSYYDRICAFGASLPREFLGDAMQLAKFAIRKPTCHAKTLAVRAASDFSSENEHLSRVFVRHAFYKGKAAMSLSPLKPRFQSIEKGGVALKREGSMFLEFAPAVAQRQYDWNQKQTFALSTVEMGTLIGLASGEGCEFFHDPHMRTSDAGKVQKTLKVDPMSDLSGHFFTLSVVNRLENIDERIVVPVTKAEFSVMKSAFNFIMPYLMGWHAFVYPSHLKDTVLLDYHKVQGSAIEGDPELEWAK
eukprot:c20346_g1_i1 orf=111-860(+)